MDEATGTPDELARLIESSSSGQLGALGEETVRVYLEDELDATIVALGDAGMPRTRNRQDLDIVAAVEGALVVFEVKTRFVSRKAGRLTRHGNLLHPKLRRAAASARQASQEYAADRLEDIVDIGEGYEGVDVQVVVVELRLMMLQFFTVEDDGTRMAPLGPPCSCVTAVQAGYDEILSHRGYL